MTVRNVRTLARDGASIERVPGLGGRMRSHGRLALALCSTGLAGCVALAVGLMSATAWLGGLGVLVLGGSLVIGQCAQSGATTRRAENARADLQNATRRSMALLAEQRSAAMAPLATRAEVETLSRQIAGLAARLDREETTAAVERDVLDLSRSRSLERLLMLMVLSGRSGGER